VGLDVIADVDLVGNCPVATYIVSNTQYPLYDLIRNHDLGRLTMGYLPQHSLDNLKRYQYKGVDKYVDSKSLH